MKQLITTFFTGFVLLATTQTPLIAHKSHSGTSTAFFIDPSSNFGERQDFYFHQQPLYKLEEFKELNDSTIIMEVRDLNRTVVRVDTLPNKSKYSPLLFEIKYRDSIRKVEEVKIYQEELKREEGFKKQLELQQQQINEPGTSKKKNKKSYLLFLFGITGGGMLLIQLFRTSKFQKSIA